MANEKRLIDALPLMKNGWHLVRTGESNRFLASMSLADVSTVDAVEVVHGSWIIKHNPITDPKKYFIRIVCSECNLHTGQKSNYCPNYGAKMDGAPQPPEVTP